MYDKRVLLRLFPMGKLSHDGVRLKDHPRRFIVNAAVAMDSHGRNELVLLIRRILVVRHLQVHFYPNMDAFNDLRDRFQGTEVVLFMEDGRRKDLHWDHDVIRYHHC